MYPYSCIYFKFHDNSRKTVAMTGINRSMELRSNLYSVVTGNDSETEDIFRDKAEAYAETLRRIIDMVNTSCKNYGLDARFTLIQTKPSYETEASIQTSATDANDE